MPNWSELGLEVIILYDEVILQPICIWDEFMDMMEETLMPFPEYICERIY